ncbi:hypothetical protein BGZ50_006586, partial [Haplosporangium sp. Z 11]
MSHFVLAVRIEDTLLSPSSDWQLRRRTFQLQPVLTYDNPREHMVVKIDRFDDREQYT